MKLNERELASFAKHSPRVDKQGYLLKRGQYNTTFRRRYFELRGNLLFYYHEKGARSVGNGVQSGGNAPSAAGCSLTPTPLPLCLRAAPSAHGLAPQ